MRMLSVLRKLLSDAQTEPFWTPVDLKMYPEYTSLVPMPMDLGTILQRTKEDAYSDEFNFIRDVLLVCSNCQKFNAEESALHQYSLRLKEEVEDLFSRWIESDDRPADPDIPYE